MKIKIVLLLFSYIQDVLTDIIYVNNDTRVDNSNGRANIYFTNLEDAILASKSGDKINLMSNITLISNLLIDGKKLNLSSDLPNCILNFSKAGALNFQSSEITIQNISMGISTDSAFIYVLGLTASTLILKTVTFQYLQLPPTLYSIIKSNSSSIYILNTGFIRINLNKALILVIFGVNKGVFLSISNSLFRAFSQSELSSASSILVKESNINVSINESTFQEIKSYTGFISVSTNKEFIRIENCYFRENWAFDGFLKFTNSFAIFISNTYSRHMNIVENIKLPEGGCFITIQNVALINFTNFSLVNAHSDKTTAGIKIFDSSMLINFITDLAYIGPRYISFQDCSFQNITTNYKTNKESGGAIILGVLDSIFLNNCFFQSIYLNSTRNADEKVGGPCILSISTTNELLIKNSLFLDCHSRFLGNGVMFFGSYLVVLGSIFENNYPIFDIDEQIAFEQYNTIFYSINDLHVEVGGALFCINEYVEIRDSIFVGNQGLIGGAVYVNSKTEASKVDFLMSGCHFLRNQGGAFGGALAFYQKFETMNALVEKSYFEANTAYTGGGIAQLTSTPSCHLLIKECFFLKNSAIWAGAVDFSNREGTCLIKDSVFLFNNASWLVEYGSGAAIKLSGGPQTKVFSLNNKFIMNRAVQEGTIILFAGLFQDKGSLFLGNRARRGAIAYILSAGEFQAYNTTFINETSEYIGIFVIKELSSVFMLNVNFQGCKSLDKGGIFVTAQRSVLNVRDSKFIGSRSKAVSILSCYENFNDITNSSIVFSNCIFQDNNGPISVFEIADSILYLINCTFLQNGQNLFDLFSSSLVIEGLYVREQKCVNDKSGCLLRAGDKSIILINNMKAQKVENTVEGAGFYLEDSNLVMAKSYILEVFSAKEGSTILSKQSEIFLFQNQFQFFNGNSIKALQSRLRLIKNSFDNLNFDKSKLPNSFELYTNGALIFDGCPVIMLFNCKLSNNKLTDRGGAMLLMNSENIDLSNIDIDIMFSVFEGNMASKEGGAIYIEDLNVTIESNFFGHNKAASGGAIFFFTRDFSSSKIKLFNNTYSENEASLEGGAIKFNNIIGEYSKEIFKNNRANYGPDVAAYPFGLKINVHPRTNTKMVFNPPLKGEMLTFTNISSGSQFPYIIEVEVIDFFGERVKSLNDVEVSVSFLEEEELKHLNLKNWNRTGFSLYPKPSLVNQGVALFQEFLMITKPGNDVYLKFTTKAIRATYLYSNYTTAGESTINGIYTYYFMVATRKCIIGEIFIKAFQTDLNFFLPPASVFTFYVSPAYSCKMCETGKYSLDDPENALCKMCPFGAECFGGNDITAKAGFWKALENSSKIWYCKDFSSKCLGGNMQNCALGYRGRLCSICDTRDNKKYSWLGVNTCAECPDLKMNSIRIAIAFLGFTILIYMLVRDYLKEADKIIHNNLDVNGDLNKYLSIYLKIMINYTQLTSIVAGMDLKWPFYVESYLKFQLNFGQLSVQILSVECLLLDLEWTQDPLFVKTLIGVILPFFLILTFYLSMLMINLFRKTFDPAHFLITFLVINYLFQPSIIKELISLLSCENFEDNTKYLIVNRDISCNSDSYLNWVYSFVLPALCYWVLIFPGVCLYYLVRNRHDLENPRIRMNFNFFLEGYSLKFYYWEFYIMLRKMAIIYVSKVLDVSILTKGTLMFYICMFSSYRTISRSPFTSSSLNRMELKSNLSSLIIVISGVFYLLVVNEYWRALMFSILIIVDFYFFMDWILNVLALIYSSKRRKIHKHFPFITHLWASWKKASLVAAREERSPKIKNTFRTIIYFKNFLNEYRSGRVKIMFDPQGNDLRDIYDVQLSSHFKTRIFSQENITYFRRETNHTPNKSKLNFSLSKVYHH